MCSCSQTLRFNRLMLLSLFAWSPFLFLGRPFDLRFLVNNAVCNMICSIIYGGRFDYGDEVFRKMVALFENSLSEEAGFLTQVTQKCGMFCKRLPSVAGEHCVFICFLFASRNVLSLALWFWPTSFLM